MKELFESVWKIIKDIINSLKNFFKKVIEIIARKKYVGFRRILKLKELEYYQSISKGKSNNWRKIHGLYLIRSSC